MSRGANHYTGHKPMSGRKRYVVVVTESRPCPKCDEADANRHDCGCISEREVCHTDSLPAARMAGGRWAKRGYPVSVDDREVGLVWSL